MQKLVIRQVFFQYLAIKHRLEAVVQIIVIKTPLLIIGVTRADLKHCGKMPEEELNRSVREWRIEIT